MHAEGAWVPEALFPSPHFLTKPQSSLVEAEWYPGADRLANYRDNPQHRELRSVFHLFLSALGFGRTSKTIR